MRNSPNTSHGCGQSNNAEKPKMTGLALNTRFVIWALVFSLMIPIAKAAPDKTAKKANITIPEKAPETKEAKPELTKAYLLERMKKATLLREEILNMIPIYKKLKADLQLSRSEKKTLASMIKKYDLENAPQLIKILKKKRLNNADLVILFSALKIIVKEEQKGVLSHNEILMRMLAHYAIIAAFRSSPELEEWIEDAPGQLEIGKQLAEELGKMAQ